LDEHQLSTRFLEFLALLTGLYLQEGQLEHITLDSVGCEDAGFPPL